MKWTRLKLIPAAAVVVLVAGAPTAAAQARPSLRLVELEGLGGSAGVTAVSRTGTALAGTAVTALSRPHAARWDLSGHITDLDPDVLYSEAVGINDAGTVAGVRDDGVDPYRTVVWDRRGRMTVLYPPSPDRERSTATAGINNDGTVAGTVFNAAGTWDYAVLWDRHGTPTRLPGLPGGRGAYAQAINDRGVVIGDVGTASAITHAARWDAQGRLVDLGSAFADAISQAYAVNARAEVVGFSSDGSGIRAVKWNADGTTAPLAALPGEVAGFAYAIADDGTAVGTATVATAQNINRQHAVRWDPRGRVTDLGPLLGGTDSSSISTPGRDGTTVGSSLTAAGHTHAVLWDRGGVVSDLGTLPQDTDSSARFLTRQGLIVGNSWGSDNVQHAVIWRNARLP